MGVYVAEIGGKAILAFGAKDEFAARRFGGGEEPVQNGGGAMPAAGGCGAGARCGGGSCWSWSGLMARRSGTRSARASASQPGIPQRRWASAWGGARRALARYSALPSPRRGVGPAARG